MSINKTIAVIGGTGKSGSYLLRQLSALQIPVRLLVRSPDALVENSLSEIVKGDARNAADVLALLKGTRAVISTLGQPKNEPTIFSQATANVLAAMNVYGITRYIVITGLNVDTPLDKKSTAVQTATDWMKVNYPKTTADKQIEYEMLSASQTDWTLVRLPLIELTEKRSEWKTSLQDCPGDKISATDLACFLVDQLSDRSFVKQAPFIANQ